MARKRFKWTRRKYRHACSLLRLMSRQLSYESCPDQPPPLVQELVDLLNRHARTPDPLLKPLRERLADREIPF